MYPFFCAFLVSDLAAPATVQTAALQRSRLAQAQARARADRAAEQQAAREAEARAQLAKASAPPLPSPPSAKTVEQTCASSGNFFSREICRFQSCRETAFFSDPVCVRFREMEAANRERLTN